MPAKKKPIAKSRFSMIQIVGGVAMAVGVVGGFIALENHWVNYPFHHESAKTLKMSMDADLAQLSNTLQQIQRNSAIKAAQDEYFFWMKQEMQYKEVKARLGRSPSREFDERMVESKQNREKAESNLKRLQESK